jgi:dCMP deaminase
MLTDKNFLNIATEISKWSKCVSKQVWAVIVKDTRILSTWYNWTPSGYINCSEYWNWEYTINHHEWSNMYEIHAEMNSILWAARNWVSIENSTIYCTLQPCFQCTKNIIWAWIKRIVYGKKYEHVDWDLIEKFIRDNKVEAVYLPY